MPFSHDIRIAVRRLGATPGHTLLIVATLALGIGAATAVFSVVDQTVLRPAPFPHADRLVDVLDINRTTGGGGSSFSPRKIVSWQSQPALFERFEAFGYQQVDVAGTAEPERIGGLQVSLGLFSMLDVRPRIGRSFQQGDGAPGSELVVIISEGLWQRRFGGDPGAIGQQLQMNDAAHTIVGVMPRRFRLLREDESFWLPYDMQARIEERPDVGFYALGRLAPGVEHGTAQHIADEMADRLQKELPLPTTWGLRLTKKNVARVDDTTRTALLVLLGAVGFVLLITCSNVANLFLAQAPIRQREMAIRSALGAGRGLLVRSVLTESVILAIVGGALGILMAQWGVSALLAAAPERMVSMSTTPIGIDARVLAVATVLTLATGLVFGLFPALQGSRPDLEHTLRASGTGGGRLAYGRLPAVLVIAEIAFAVVLLVGAALMTRTLANLNAIEPGFDPDGLVTMHVALPSHRYPTSNSRIEFFERVAEQLKGAPGVRHVAASVSAPPGIGGITFGRTEVEGRGVMDTKMATIPNGTVSAGYFDALRIPLVAGRTFVSDEAPNTVIVSRDFADRYWPDGSAVGGRFRMGPKWPWLTVAGVAGSIQATAGGDDRTTLQFYYPWVKRAPAPSAVGAAPPASAAARRTYDYRQIIVRADDPAAAIPLIKQAIWSIDPQQPVEKTTLVADSYAAMFAKQRFVLVVMGSFALVALVLTAAGIFGVLSQVVARRSREIGIRMALGARPGDVMRLVVSRGIMLAAIGAALGIAGALALVRTVSALLYGVTATDPVSFASVTLLLLVVALIACWLPTRAAMRVDPAVALRTD